MMMLTLRRWNFKGDYPKFKEVIVAPIYTVDPQVHRPDFLEALRQGKYPDLFYLPADPTFLQMVESYIRHYWK
jgi:hypothetical protein